VIQKAVKQAVECAGSSNPVGCQLFCHCLANHLLECGQDIRAIQEVMCHQYLNARMIYTDVLKRGPTGVLSPAGQV